MPYDEVMHKWKAGQLHSGSKKGPTVTNQKQAVAIMLSEKRKAEEGKKEYKPMKKYQRGGSTEEWEPKPKREEPIRRLPKGIEMQPREEWQPQPRGPGIQPPIGEEIEPAEPPSASSDTTALKKGGSVTKNSDRANWRRW